MSGYRNWIVAAVVAVLAAGGGYFFWLEQGRSRLPDGISGSNGRIEAEQIQIATKLAGRVVEVLPREGDMVDRDEVLARMDPEELEAQLRAAKAQVTRAEKSLIEAQALVAQREGELVYAGQELTRTTRLHGQGFETTEKLDLRRSALNTAEAARRAAAAGVDVAHAAIEAAKADARRLSTLLKETVLTAPIRGRIQYRLAEPGEVLASGGRVLTLLDLTDVHMTVFLPARIAGQLSVGEEARIVLDPVPQYVIPAQISFVAAEAQFTPKSVETAEERAKLMFRVKLSIDPGLLRKYEDRVKAGVRGLAYVRISSDLQWPDTLEVKLPE